jgi:hypothetical protein
LTGEGETSESVFRQNKVSLTFPTSINAADMHEVKLLVTGIYNQPRAFKRAFRLPVHDKAQKYSGVDKGIFLD